jgi:hypothetical protein
MQRLRQTKPAAPDWRVSMQAFAPGRAQPRGTTICQDGIEKGLTHDA